MLDLKEIRELKQLQRLDFIANAIVEGFITGLHRSPYHGFSVEFSEHRPYNSGESIRFIDWKLYARTEKLFVKKFEQETNLRSFFVLDTSSSMLFPYDLRGFSKLEFGIYATAALMFLLQRQRDASGLIMFADDIEFFSQAKLNRVHQNLLLTKLQYLLEHQKDLARNRKTKISGIFHHIADNLPRRSLVVIFSDFLVDEPLEDIIAALEHLRYNKHEVIIFYLLDEKLELNFDFENRGYKFVDIETGEILKLNPNQVRESYQSQFSRFLETFKIRCGQMNIDFVRADINGDFAEILVSYLLKRQKLF